MDWYLCRVTYGFWGLGSKSFVLWGPGRRTERAERGHSALSIVHDHLSTDNHGGRGSPVQSIRSLTLSLGSKKAHCSDWHRILSASRRRRHRIDLLEQCIQLEFMNSYKAVEN